MTHRGWLHTLKGVLVAGVALSLSFVLVWLGAAPAAAATEIRVSAEVSSEGVEFGRPQAAGNWVAWVPKGGSAGRTMLWRNLATDEHGTCPSGRLGDGYVVWSEPSDGPSSSLMIYDLVKKQQRVLVSVEADKYVFLRGISGDKVLWVKSQKGSEAYTNHAIDIQGEVDQVLPSPLNDAYGQWTVCGDWFLWIDYTSWDIVGQQGRAYAQSLISGETLDLGPVIHGNVQASPPQLVADGPWVVWHSTKTPRSWPDDDILYYNLNSRIAGVAVGSQRQEVMPSVSRGWVVWEELEFSGGRSQSIRSYLKRLPYGEVEAVSPAAGRQYFPTISLPWAVWIDDRSGRWEVYARWVVSFAPEPNGYQFPNKGYKDAEAGRAAWTRLFDPLLFDGAQTWWEKLWGGYPMKPFAEKLFAGGVCYGMAASALAAHEGVLDPASFRAGADTLWDLGDYGITRFWGSFSQLPANLKSTIEEYFVAQYAEPAYESIMDNTVFAGYDDEYPHTMKEFIESLQGALTTGPVLLAVWDTKFGHGVVAYRVDMDFSGTGGRICIYDSHHPGEPRYVSFNLTGAGSWSYSPLVKTPLAIGWVPFGAVQQMLIAPSGSLEYHHAWVWASNDAAIRFVGASGGVTGKVNGHYVLDNPQVRLDPVLDGGLGPKETDRYAVQGSSTRTYRLESEGTDPVWASGRGPEGGYVLLVDGSLDVAAAYGGTDVSFSGAMAEEIRLAVENGSVLGAGVFHPPLRSAAWEAAAAVPGQGAVRLIGPSVLEVKAGFLTTDELMLGTSDRMLRVPDPPAARALRVDLQGFDVAQGTIALSLDRDGDGTFEATQRVRAERTVTNTFSDITLSPYKIAIQSLAEAGIINGYQVGERWEFRPAQPVLRAQFAKMAVLSLGLKVSEGGTPLPFKDVERPGNNLYPDDYVAVAAANGLIQGYAGGYFQPYVDITRAQLLTIVVRMAERFRPQALSAPSPSWKGTLPSGDSTHGANIRTAEHSGLLDGIELSAFSIWQPATRGEVAQILWNLREK